MDKEDFFIDDDLFGIGDKQIMDPVHGGFRVYAHELAIIDRPLFQRLRFIKQNDVATLVFPGALHTRFHHSLGVMHIAGRVYRSVIMNHLRWTASARTQAVSKEEGAAIRYFYYCFRLAALLHDTGHFPFSHAFESATFARALLADEDVRAFVLDPSQEEGPAEHVSHEDFSLRCASHLIEEAKTQINFPVEDDDVLALMEKSPRKPSHRFAEHAKALVRVLLRAPQQQSDVLGKKASEVMVVFLSKLISGELDVDKMDYLLRDSHFTGVSYGLYNLDHLISTLRIGLSPDPWWVGVAILDKGIGALEDFVFSRFQLYSNVWSHKGVSAGKLLLSKAIDETLADSTIQDKVRASLTDIGEFSFFTEDFFWELFREKARRDPQSFSARLLRRELPRHLCALDSPTDFEHRQKLAELKIDNPTVYDYQTHIKFSKIRQQSFDSMKVLVRGKHPDGRTFHELREIRKITDFFAKFEDTSRVHFYAT